MIDSLIVSYCMQDLEKMGRYLGYRLSTKEAGVKIPNIQFPKKITRDTAVKGVGLGIATGIGVRRLRAPSKELQKTAFFKFMAKKPQKGLTTVSHVIRGGRRVSVPKRISAEAENAIARKYLRSLGAG